MPERGPPTLKLDRFGGGAAHGPLPICALTVISLLRLRSVQIILSIAMLYALPLDLATLDRLPDLLSNEGPSHSTH